MEVIRETPLKLTLEEQIAETPRDLRPPFTVMSSLQPQKRKTPHAPSTSKKLRLDVIDESKIKSRDIEARIRLLFPKDNVSAKPCMSARLFAAYTITIEHSSPSNGRDQDNGKRMTRRGNSSNLPILSLLQALVHVESTALGKTVEKRTVQFSGFDGSSTKPPRDSILGSHIPRHLNMDAMVAALDEINKLISQSEDTNNVLTSLQSLILFLKRVSTCRSQEFVDLREECAKSMPFHWKPNRFQTAAAYHLGDLEKICLSLQSLQSLSDSNVQLALEKKLASALGLAIRYHLRRFFNPVYGTVIESADLKKQDDMQPFKRKSKLSQIIKMRMPDWYQAGCDSAVADGSVSTVFGLAIETIVAYFGIDALVQKDFNVPAIPRSFCDSEASMRGIGKSPASPKDLEAIISDMYLAQGFLSACKACRFLADLKNWPGVDEEIQRLGGWGILEKCAKQFRCFQLERLSPNDAHFCILDDVGVLMDRVEQCWIAYEDAADACTRALDQQWMRFECGSKSWKRRERYPEINIVEEVLVEGLKAHMFPHICEQKSDEGQEAVIESELEERCSGDEQSI